MPSRFLVTVVLWPVTEFDEALGGCGSEKQQPLVNDDVISFITLINKSREDWRNTESQRGVSTFRLSVMVPPKLLTISVSFSDQLKLELSSDYFFNRVNRAINYFNRALTR